MNLVNNLVTIEENNKRGKWGGSPGLVGDSCSEGCGFKSKYHILDGRVSHLFVVKIVMFV